MTKEQSEQYQSTEELRAYLKMLYGQKYKLDCGHHCTWGHHLGSSLFIYQDSNLKIVCSLCGY